jgi:hypothetical protein
MSSTPFDPDALLQDALIAFTGCIGESLDNLCTYGLTIGDSYVPFRPDPEDEEADEDDDCTEDACNQAWVRVMGISAKPDPNTEGWGGNCAPLLTADLEVGILRCFEIGEGGEAPTASEVLVAAMQSMTDMAAIHKAALSCEAFPYIESQTWQPLGPSGGQYGGMWGFTVEIVGGCLVSGNDSE